MLISKNPLTQDYADAKKDSKEFQGVLNPLCIRRTMLLPGSLGLSSGGGEESSRAGFGTAAPHVALNALGIIQTSWAS